MKNSKLRYRYAVACLVLTLVSGGSDASQPVVDQENLGLGGFSAAVISSSTYAQTVTADQSGVLSSVGLRLRKQTGAQVVDPIFRILPVGLDGVPSTDFADALFTTTVPVESIPTSDNNTQFLPYVLIDVLSAGIEVEPNDRFAISLSRAVPSQPWVLWRTSTDTYDGGVFFNQRSTNGPWETAGLVPYDGGFVTLVVPEPTGVALLTVSMLAGVLRPRPAARALK